MITKTGLIYSDNEDLSQGTYSGTIEEDGEVNTINLPDFPIGTTVYCKAYCIDDGERIESNIENYTIEMPIEVDWFGIKNEHSGTNTIWITRSNDTDISTAASYLEYSKNGEDWTKTTTSTSVTLNYGETLYIRGDDSGYLSGKDGSTYVYWTLRGSENHSTVGNIMTLIEYSQEAVLTDYSFYFLFNGDSKLISPPKLPATTLAPNCYNYIFADCSSLTTAPALPATTLELGCYSGMFFGCSSLSEVTTYANDISANGCIDNWLYGVASTGTFNNLGTATYTVDSTSGIPTGWTEVKPQPEIDYFYFKNETANDETYTIVSDSTPASTPQYSIDLSNWINFENDINITVQAGEKLYMRSSNGLNSGGRFWRIFISGDFSLGGNLSTLVDWNNLDSNTAFPDSFMQSFIDEGSKTYLKSAEMVNTGNITTIGQYSFFGTFGSADNMTKGPDFSKITTIGNYGLYNGFNMSGLTTPPDFSSLTSIGNNGMGNCFRNCVSLLTPPDFSSLTSIGNSGMESCFTNCDSLASAPDFSSLTSVGEYGMSSCFNSCSSITQGPDLSGLTTINSGSLNGCFIGCDSLTTPANLSNVTSIDVDGMSSCYGSCRKLSSFPDLGKVTTIAAGGLRNCFFEAGSYYGPITTPPNFSSLTSIGNSGMVNCFKYSPLTVGPNLRKVTSIGDLGMQDCFSNCYVLYEVTTPNVSTWNETTFKNWLNQAGAEVTGTKTVYCPTGVTIPENYSGIPIGWTRVDY